MTLAQIQGVITKIVTSLKTQSVFAEPNQVALDIATSKSEAVAEAGTYTDTKVQQDLSTLEANLTAEIATQAGTAENNAKTYTDSEISTVNAAITAYQNGINALIDARVSQLGTFLGTSTTYAGLPTQDQLGNAITSGDFVHLTQDDGTHLKGLYRYDGTNYVFISGDPAITEVFTSLKYTAIDDTNDDKFITGKYLADREAANQPTQAEVDAAVAAG